MRDDNYKSQKQRGATLVELLVVLVIIVSLSTIALMQFGSSKQQFVRQNVAGELKVAFERARFDSVKRRADSSGEWAKVVVTSNSFTLTTDANMDGDTTDSGDSAVNSFASQNISISEDGATLPATVYFNRRGETVNSSGISINPVFLVCNGTCTFASDTSANANIVLVTPTGTVNLLAGGSPVPSFSPPQVSTVSPGSEIRNEVTIP